MHNLFFAALLLSPCLFPSSPAAVFASTAIDCEGGCTVSIPVDRDFDACPQGTNSVLAELSGVSGYCFEAPDGGCAGRPCTVTVKRYWRIDSGNTVELCSQTGAYPESCQAPIPGDGQAHMQSQERSLFCDNQLATFSVKSNTTACGLIMAKVRARCSTCD